MKEHQTMERISRRKHGPYLQVLHIVVLVAIDVAPTQAGPSPNRLVARLVDEEDVPALRESGDGGGDHRRGVAVHDPFVRTEESRHLGLNLHVHVKGAVEPPGSATATAIVVQRRPRGVLVLLLLPKRQEIEANKVQQRIPISHHPQAVAIHFLDHELGQVVTIQVVSRRLVFGHERFRLPVRYQFIDFPVSESDLRVLRSCKGLKGSSSATAAESPKSMTHLAGLVWQSCPLQKHEPQDKKDEEGLDHHVLRQQAPVSCSRPSLAVQHPSTCGSSMKVRHHHSL
eukprot:scaffold3504_cov240-Pinguiococcus_pyrenoidosus.AAC.62